MAQSDNQESYSFDRPGIYRICIQGFLDENWSERLAGMRVTTEKRKDHGLVTALVVQLRDQAELSGVLNTLYERHLTLLSVEIVENDKSK